MKTNLPTRITLFAGVGMIGSTLIAPMMATANAFSIVGLVWGSLLLCCAITIHHRAERREIEKEIRLKRLDTLAAGVELKKELLAEVLKNGLPDGLSREWVERILDWNSLGKDLPEQCTSELKLWRTQSC
jgi:hypothetical protein